MKGNKSYFCEILYHISLSVCPLTGETIGHNLPPPEARNKTEAKAEVFKQEEPLASRKKTAKEATSADEKLGTNLVAIFNTPKVKELGNEKQCTKSEAPSTVKAEEANPINETSSPEKTVLPKVAQTAVMNTENLTLVSNVSTHIAHCGTPAAIIECATPATVSTCATPAPVLASANPAPVIASATPAPVIASATSAPVIAIATPVAVKTSATPAPFITSGTPAPILANTTLTPAKVDAAPIPVKSRRVPPGGHTTAFW